MLIKQKAYAEQSKNRKRKESEIMASVQYKVLCKYVHPTTKKAVTNPADTEKQFNRADVNAFFKLMPLNNLMGVNTILNHISSDLPVSSKEE